MVQIDCANCPKQFEKFRDKQPFKNTCKKCIMRAWHIPLEERKKYARIPSLFNYLNKTAPIPKLKPNGATTLKISTSIKDLEINLKLTDKELKMIKICSQLKDNIRFAFYHRIRETEPENELLKYLKNW